LFSDLLEKEKAKDKKIDTTQGPNEKKANAYLDAMLNLALTNEEERALIIKAKEALRQGRFQNLAKRHQ
jgi:DNA-directed RNA polymerase beta' subunit